MEADSKNLCIATGGGWPDRMAWNPSDKLMLKNEADSELKLAEFVKKNNDKLIMGFLSYDFGYQLLDVKKTKPDDLGLPDVYFLAFDNWLENGKVAERPVGDRTRKPILEKSFISTISRRQYDKAFDNIQEYIRAGHIYQINLTHRLESTTSQNPRDIFFRLAKKNLGPMMSYIEGPDFEILSASPERFIKIKDGLITTTPIKGTRSKAADAQKQLMSDEKEQAELNMITDLLRNDVAKVSVPGSVKVESQREIQTLTNVIHTYSKISGKLLSEVEPIEALISMFPGGSITGVPKKRAMEIIDEVEPVTRSAYCGSMVCISPDGELDSNILIRTIIKKGERMVLPVGGGIVFDSKRDDEYQETLDKAAAIINSLNS